MTEEEREDWELEQKRLDREWYGMDEGYDDEHNPFSGMSSEYTKRKEEEVEKKKKKKMTARQAQHQRVRFPRIKMFNLILKCFNFVV